MKYLAPTLRLTLVKEAPGSYRGKRKIEEAKDVYAAVKDVFDTSPVELFCVLLLDTGSRLIGVAPVGLGILTSCLAHPREVFGPAILANAHCIIVAHCHPSGDPTPSDEDRNLTARLIEAGKMLGIPLVDHVVVANGLFVSIMNSTGDPVFDVKVT